MKAKIVPFKDLSIGTFFIIAKVAPDCQVFEKIHKNSAVLYGDEQGIIFDLLHDVIIVAETTFEKLPLNHQFAFSDAAEKISGLIVNTEIYIKTDTDYLSYLGEHEPIARIKVTPVNRKVIDFSNTFKVQMVRMVTFNTD
jgi:hypothetical protein